MSPAFAKTDCVGKKRAPQGNLVIRVSNGSDAVQIWRPWRWCLVARSSPKIQTLLSQGLDELERIKKSSKLQDYGHTSSGPTVYVLVTGRLYSDLKKCQARWFEVKTVDISAVLGDWQIWVMRILNNCHLKKKKLDNLNRFVTRRFYF